MKIMSKLAIFGGEPVRKKPFPRHPIITKDEIDAVNKVLKSGKLSTFHSSFAGGEKVKEFEENLAKYHGVDYAIVVNSGTAALHVSLAAAGIGPGDEVVVPPYTFTATATSVLMSNAIPIFADVDYKSFNISPERVEERLTKKTKAIIPVHLLGNPAEMDRIMEIANDHDLIVIEDAAQAIGGKYRNKFVGTVGHLGIFSFQETKTIMTGEGGAIITNDENLAERCRMIRNHGEQLLFGKPRTYLSNILGWNYRMTEIEAAIGVEQLKKLDKFNETRIKNSHFLLKSLSGIEGLSFQHSEPFVKHVYHLFGMTLDEQAFGISRETFLKALAAEGVPASTLYPRPLYENPLFKEKIVYGNKGCPFTCKFFDKEIEYRSGMCPITEKLCKTVIVTNVIRPPATIDDMKDTVDSFRKVAENVNQLKQQ